MDLREILGKNIFIRLTEDSNGFVSTVRFGMLYRKTESWAVGTAVHTSVEIRGDDTHKRE